MTDYAEIIAQLRDHIGHPIPSMRFAAADALEAQARRIAELERQISAADNYLEEGDVLKARRELMGCGND